MSEETIEGGPIILEGTGNVTSPIGLLPEVWELPFGHFLLAFLNTRPEEIDRGFVERLFVPFVLPFADPRTWTDEQGQVQTQEKLLETCQEAAVTFQEAAAAYLTGAPLSTECKTCLEGYLEGINLIFSSPGVSFPQARRSDLTYGLFPITLAAYEFWLIAGKLSRFRLRRCEYIPCSRFWVGGPTKAYCSAACRMAACRYGRDDHKRKRRASRQKLKQQTP